MLPPALFTSTSTWDGRSLSAASHRIGIRRVEHDRACTDLLGRRLEHVLTPAGDHHVEALLDEPGRHGLADAGAAAGHHCCSGHATFDISRIHAGRSACQPSGVHVCDYAVQAPTPLGRNHDNPRSGHQRLGHHLRRDRRRRAAADDDRPADGRERLHCAALPLRRPHGHHLRPARARPQHAFGRSHRPHARTAGRGRARGDRGSRRAGRHVRVERRCGHRAGTRGDLPRRRTSRWWRTSHR